MAADFQSHLLVQFISVGNIALLEDVLHLVEAHDDVNLAELHFTTTLLLLLLVAAALELGDELEVLGLRLCLILHHCKHLLFLLVSH